MSLEQAFAEYLEKNNPLICSFAQLLLSMSLDDKNATEKALANQIPGSIVVKLLRTAGYKTSKDSIYAHVNKECKCPSPKS